MSTALSIDAILTLAERESGAYGLADEGLRQRVSAFIDWINERGPYSLDQVGAMRRQIQRVLVNRLRIALDRNRYPAIAGEKIDRPIFIVGFPRSGTTLLHSLLAEHPDLLAPQSWHSHSPSPPPGAAPVCAGRIAFVQRAVEAWIDFCPGQLVMHPYLDKGAHQLIEDEELFTLDFHLAYAYHFYRVPTLDSSTFHIASPTAALRFHREVLQHLQWNTGRHRWVCKGVTAQGHLNSLFEVYPDALCVWAHRSMADIYASSVALGALIYDTVNGEPNDWASTTRAAAERMKAAFDHVMANSLVDDPRIIHLPFRQLSADPVVTIRQILSRAEIPVTPRYESRLREWLVAPENQVDRYGRYPYSYEACGLDREWIEDLFADYAIRFDLK